MCDSAFSEPYLDQSKMIKCHQFAYGFDWLKENVPNSDILLVKRDSDKSFDWWKQAGGWDITYPNYSWYIDDVHMQHYIDNEIKLANLFVAKTDNEWTQFTENWITENFGQHTISLSEKYNDTEVCLIRTNV